MKMFRLGSFRLTCRPLLEIIIIEGRSGKLRERERERERKRERERGGG